MFRGRANFLFIYFTEDSICTWTQICHDNSIYSARHLILKESGRKKYSIFFHNVPTLVGIFIILKELFELKKRSQKGRNNKNHLFNGGNIRENFICENITPFFGNRINFEMYVFN